MQDKDNQKNLVLAIVLSMAVLFAWQFFYAAPKEQERQTRIRQEQAAKAKEQAPPAPSAPGTGIPGGVPGTAAKPGQPGAAPAPGDQATIVTTRLGALGTSPRVGIDTPALKGSIALKGGRIDDVVLARYRETVDPKSPNVEMFSPSGSPHPYYAEFGWTADKGVTQPIPDSNTLWRAETSGPLTTQSPVKLSWDNGHGLVFRRTVAVDPDYMFTVTDEVENKSGSAVSLYPYALISRHGMPKVDGVWMILHEGFIGALGPSGLKEVGYGDVLKEGASYSFKQTGGWLGITDKYWAAALVPDATIPTEARFSGSKGTNGAKDTFQADVSPGRVEVAQGAKSTFTSHLFAGAKVVSLIEDYHTKLSAEGTRQFNMLFDWGYFWFLTKPLYWLLHWLGQLLGNYGLAILATTVLVKALFFPLANKSYESMAKMKLLQPEMEKLRERYKDDRAKMQQELMTLYREKKINPMAGCLPILVQVPVFFALYKVLYLTIDMRQAPFFGWIRDLSAPDPTSIFNLFGLLPFAAPDFLHVGVWPIVMGITMWVQMQLNPQQADPMQQKIFNWMPVMFTFLLANFASGLVIYWAWNNLLSLTQQYLIMKRNGAEIHLWKNLGVDKAVARLKGGTGGQGANSGGDLMGRAGAAVRGGMGRLAQQADGLKRAVAQRLQPAETATRPASAGAAAAVPAGDDGTPANAAKAEMTREEAFEALGLEPGATAAQIDAAYKARARQNGSLNGTEKLSRARDVLRGNG
jgi:YidC/Oxa1 family membrane protein insertase